jgi:hypothetical protein
LLQSFGYPAPEGILGHHPARDLDHSIDSVILIEIFPSAAIALSDSIIASNAVRLLGC